MTFKPLDGSLQSMSKDFVYLDYNASTPLAEEVLQAMLPYFTQNYGNPTSLSHSFSWAAAGGMTLARQQVADFLQCEPSEILFTSGATESINLALWGVLEQTQHQVFTSTFEHSATFETFRATHKLLQHPLVFLKGQKNGLVDLATLDAALKTADPQKPKLVSLILANNEFGSLYDLKELSDICRTHKALLHVDATQALLTQRVQLKETPVDLLSLSAHKLYGPKGVGALYINKSTLGHSLSPRIYGGGQEFGLRSGTPNVPGIVGLGRACELIKERRSSDAQHFKSLYEFFEGKMRESGLRFFLNGDPEKRIFNNISVTFPEHQQVSPLTLALSPFGITQGASCGAQSGVQNRVLSAIGLNAKEIQNTIRIGLGRATGVSDLEKLVEKLQQVI